jgi:hypothetical protein
VLIELHARGYHALTIADLHAIPVVRNTLADNLVAYRDTPHGGGERNAMRAVAREVLDELHARGHHALTLADLQAVLWYGEKDLYEDLDDDNQPDYAHAATALATKQGIDRGAIDVALARGAKSSAERTRATRRRLGRHSRNTLGDHSLVMWGART